MNRRKINRSFVFINNQTADWNNKTSGDWLKYRGPMVSWIRFCSNGKGAPDFPQKQNADGSYTNYSRRRFVFHSGKGFYQSYGFQPTSTPGVNQQVIGYMPNSSNTPHIIENSLTTPSDEPTNYPIHVPPPEISKMEVTVQKELFRRATIEWVCFSWKQLVYMTPYFLVPGITCMVEWGWNHYNVNSLVDLSNVNTMQQLWDNAYPLYTNNIIASNGNYDVLYGFITNFNWSIEGTKIICTTEITSKDKLYAGIVKDYGLSVKDSKNTNSSVSLTPKIFRSLKDFLTNDDNMKNLRRLVTTQPILSPNSINLVTETRVDPQNPSQDTWGSILQPLLTKQTNSTGSLETFDQVAIRYPWVFGFFGGRPNYTFNKGKFGIIGGKPTYTVETVSYGQSGYQSWGTPKPNDFDVNIQDNSPKPDKMWINMGMVVSMLNYFSTIPSGAGKGNNQFYVDIQNTIIGGHPNLVSCDPQVLIPNYKAPKFLYGNVGIQDWVSANGSHADDYLLQVLRPLHYPTDDKPSPDLTLYRKMLQSGGIYRDNLDSIINYNRYRFAKLIQNAGINIPTYYSFPAQENTLLPDSSRGLKGNMLEMDYSGLLSNIYISYKVLKDAVQNDGINSVIDIYAYIFDILMRSVDGFWDLALVEVDGIMTVTDRNYVGKYSLLKQEESIYSFDYYDVDSLIKSLKFRPVLSDIQAIRTIYGNVNNNTAKYTILDKNDLLNYQFKDDVITPSTPDGDGDKGNLNRRTTGEEQYRELLRLVQNINSSPEDDSLQMSLNPERLGLSLVGAQSGGYPIPPNNPDGRVEIVKLVLNNRQLLRILLDDGDEDNNPRYCAVQPGIILELTIQGIGGLRTFQYFLVKNLPPPYSERDMIFRITDVHHTLETGNWETLIRAQPLPLRGYIKNRLKGPLTNVKNIPNVSGWPISTTPFQG